MSNDELAILIGIVREEIETLLYTIDDSKHKITALQNRIENAKVRLEQLKDYKDSLVKQLEDQVK